MNVFYYYHIFQWRKSGFNYGCIGYYRYRYDPVPNAHRRRKFRQHKRGNSVPHERRRCHEDKEYIRGKRSFPNLPNAWNDVRRGDFKFDGCVSWKNKRVKKQYMKNLN